MKLIKRVSIVFLVLLVFVVATVAVIVVVIPETDLMRTAVQDQLRNLSGHEVSIGALKISGSFPRIIQITADKVSVSSKSGERLFFADRVMLSPALAPLLKKKVVVKSVTIDGFRITVWRSKDGAIRLPIVAVRNKSPSTNVIKERRASIQSDVDSTGNVDTEMKPLTREARAAGLNWSVEKVNLGRGRIDWIDLYVSPGKQVVLSLLDITGSLIRLKRKEASCSVDIKCKVGKKTAEDMPVKLDGLVTVLEDLSGLKSVDFSLLSNRLDLKPFHVYVPNRFDLFRGFTRSDLKARIKWRKGSPADLSFRTNLRGKAETPQRLDITGTAVAAEDFSEIQELRCTAETDFLPLRLFWSTLPAGFPFKLTYGTIKGRVQGEWRRGEDWKAHGALSLEKAVPRGVFKSVADSVRVWAQGRLNPNRMLIENLEILGTAKLASISGKIFNPLSTRPTFDLKGTVSIKTEWLKNFGFRVPRNIRLKGNIPVKGSVRGTDDELWLDLAGNLTQTTLAWRPYLAKEAGEKGTISIKGKFHPRGSKNKTGHTLNALMRLGIVGARLNLSPKGVPLSPAALRVDGTVLMKGRKIDLRNTTVVVRRVGEARETISAKVSVGNLGSTHPNVNGRATLNFNQHTPRLAGFDKVPELKTMGSAPLKARFSRTKSIWKWSLYMPLTDLDVTVGNMFRKPAGVTGTVKASGQWSNRELTLKSLGLNLPGVDLSGHGRLMDMEGSFLGLTLSLKKTDVKDLLRFIPAMAGAKARGPVEATVRIKASEKGVIPFGFIKMQGIDFRPKKRVGWHAKKVRGAVKTEGDSVKIATLSGKLGGTVRGPFRVRASLNQISSLEKVNGLVKVFIGPGKIKARSFLGFMNQVRLLTDTVLRTPEEQKRTGDFLDYEKLTGDLEVKYGEIHTDNLRLKSPLFRSGMIGKIGLGSPNLDLLAGITGEVPSSIRELGRIPSVQDALKKHSGLLKATGLAKELKRLGFKVPDNGTSQSETSPTKVAPIVVFLKIQGPLSEPKVSPVLESALDRKTLSRIKYLMD